MSGQQWEKIAEAKRAALVGTIPQEFRIPEHLIPPQSQLDVTSWPKESGWFTPKELEITESTAKSIVEKLATQKWSSEEVTRAFCKRAAAAHQLVSLERLAAKPMV
jgi:amidase